MKFRYSLTGGGTVSLRDSVELAITAPPPIGITKGVRDVNGVPAGGNPPDTDHVQVLDDDEVTFRIDLTNNGSATTNNAVPILGPDVWDALPTGITCADISAISDGGACTDPGDGTHPTFAAAATLQCGALAAAERSGARARRQPDSDLHDDDPRRRERQHGPSPTRPLSPATRPQRTGRA